MAEVSPELEEWIRENYRKGYTVRQLKDKLLESGHDPTVVDEVLLQPPNTSQPGQQEQEAQRREPQQRQGREPVTRQQESGPSTEETPVADRERPRLEQRRRPSRGEEDAAASQRSREPARSDTAAPTPDTGTEQDTNRDTDFDTDFDTDTDTDTDSGTEFDTDFDTDLDTGTSTAGNVLSGVKAGVGFIGKTVKLVWTGVKKTVSFLAAYWRWIAAFAALGFLAWFIAGGGLGTALQTVNTFLGNILPANPVFG